MTLPPSTPWLLRPAQPADALCLGALATQVFFDTYATRGISADLALEARALYAEDAMASRLATPGVQITVAEAAGHLLGFVDLQWHSTCPVATVQGPEVLRLYIQAPFQRQGLGAQLLRQAEIQAQAQAAPALWLTAWVGNARALAFYAALGYQTVGRTPYLINGQAFENVVLAKALGGPAATETGHTGP